MVLMFEAGISFPAEVAIMSILPKIDHKISVVNISMMTYVNNRAACDGGISVTSKTAGRNSFSCSFMPLILLSLAAFSCSRASLAISQYLLSCSIMPQPPRWRAQSARSGCSTDKHNDRRVLKALDGCRFR